MKITERTQKKGGASRRTQGEAGKSTSHQPRRPKAAKLVAPHALEQTVHTHTAPQPCRSGGGQSSTAAARRIHPPGGGRNLQLLIPGAALAAENHSRRAKKWTRSARRRCCCRR